MNGFQQIMLDSLAKSKTGGGKMEDKNQEREREEEKKTEKLMEVERLKD